MARLRRCASLLILLALMACSGDPGLFEEAAEVEALDLESLRVVPPVNAQERLFINPGESVTLTLEGGTVAGETITIDSNDRRWSVSEPAFATISGNGVLTGRADGDVVVSVSLGDVEVQTLNVSVLNASLRSIVSIEGEDSIDRCVPSSYYAVGAFSANDTEATHLRTLTSVDWTIDDPDNAERFDGDNGATFVNGLNADTIMLTAENPEEGTVVPSLSQDVSVTNTLQEINILPTGSSDIIVSAGNNLQVLAQGTYGLDDNRSNQDITNGVNWEINPSNDSVTVNNTRPNKGLLRGESADNATLQISCGDLSDSRTITINGSSSSGLVARQQSVTVAINGTVNLNVSTGSTYASSRDITDRASWRVTTGSNAISVTNSSPNRGVVRGLLSGTGTVTATFEGTSVDISVTVQ